MGTGVAVGGIAILVAVVLLIQRLGRRWNSKVTSSAAQAQNVHCCQEYSLPHKTRSADSALEEFGAGELSEESCICELDLRPYSKREELEV